MNPSKVDPVSVSDPKALGFRKETAWSDCMTLIQNGQVEALASLYDDASSLVFSVALRILGNRADAEEVTLDVFTQVWRSAASWDQKRGSVMSWLVLLARSRALDRARWRKSRTQAELSKDLPVHLHSAEQNAEELFEVREQEERVKQAMMVLSEAQRTSLNLAFYGGFTHQQIAESLGEPLGTIKSRIRDALIRLKKELEGARP